HRERIAFRDQDAERRNASGDGRIQARGRQIIRRRGRSDRRFQWGGLSARPRSNATSAGPLKEGWRPFWRIESKHLGTFSFTRCPPQRRACKTPIAVWEPD